MVIWPARAGLLAARRWTRSRTYVENGGKAIIMLDPPLKFAKQNVADNAALIKVLAGLGRHRG